ncbi:MAG: cytosine deaminase [Pseudanabaenaceae cyanobacterium bins.68]|nr:cytosine deaminase [Pseudanabaenaceae cyanobacterium bins.68]
MYSIPSDHFWLIHAAVPVSLLPDLGYIPDRENLGIVNLEINQGQIVQVSDRLPESTSTPVIDLQNNLVLPCFVDIHTHLDKGHSWPRTPNPDGSFDGAIQAINYDHQFWQPEELYARMEFGLKCSYAHGTKALRTHLDLLPDLTDQSLAVFKALQHSWRDRLELQPAALVQLSAWQGEAGEQLAAKIAEIGGAIGGLVMPNQLENLERVFNLAQHFQLDLDFHVDETGDPESNALEQVAKIAIAQKFGGKILCGHCCNLSVQEEDLADQVIYLVKQANIQIVSLPACNLYLQDRQVNQTPRWRGVTLLHELKAAQVPIAIAHDNARDPFYGFGDHDLLEIFRLAVQIAHLDMPYGDWINSITQVPAQIMDLEAKLLPGTTADLIIFNARSYSELLARPQSDRLILRRGQKIHPELPSYRELDLALGLLPT